MKNYFTYLIWSLFTLIFVFAGIAALVALLDAQEMKILNQVVVLQVDQIEQDYLSQAVSFTEQVETFADADLATRIARNAYSSELPMEDTIERTNLFLRDLMDEINDEIHSQLGISNLGTDTLLAYATIDAVLYDSPSGSTKIPYWLIIYQWHPTYDKILTEENWPIYDLEVYSDTLTGNPFCVKYHYYPFMHFSEVCGITAYAKILGLEDELEITEAHPYVISDERADGSSWASGGEAQMADINFYFPLKDQAFSILKSLYISKEAWASMQLVPNKNVNDQQ